MSNYYSAVLHGFYTTLIENTINRSKIKLYEPTLTKILNQVIIEIDKLKETKDPLMDNTKSNFLVTYLQLIKTNQLNTKNDIQYLYLLSETIDDMINNDIAQYRYKYGNSAKTADNVILKKDDKNNYQVLLILRSNNPYKDCWALPGGFVDPGEDGKEAAYRELKEETGLTLEMIEKVEYIDEFSGSERDPRTLVTTYAFMALIKNEFVDYVKPSSDAKDYKWAQLDEYFTCSEPLAFDHQKIIKKAQIKL